MKLTTFSSNAATEAKRPGAISVQSRSNAHEASATEQLDVHHDKTVNIPSEVSKLPSLDVKSGHNV